MILAPVILARTNLHPLGTSLPNVSCRCRELAHQQVEQGNPPPAELEAPAQEEEAAVELVHSSGAEFEMVTKRVMSISRFVPDAQTPEQQQPPPAQVQSPPSPPPLSR